MTKVSIADKFKIGEGEPLTLIAGPCVIENQDFNFKMAEEIQKICRRLNVNFIYKSSFDKANRTSSSSFRGVDIRDGLQILQYIKTAINVPIITDIHESWQAAPVAEVADVLQIPAFLCRQTDLLIAAAQTGNPVNLKKGQFLAPWDMKNVVKKLQSAGATQILLTERGTSFGYNTLVVDYRGLVQMREFGCPIVFDATHSVQMPGGNGDSSGGQREFVSVLAKAAMAVGIDALFMEVHENPDSAPSDGANMIALHNLEKLLVQLLQIRAVVQL